MPKKKWRKIKQNYKKEINKLGNVKMKRNKIKIVESEGWQQIEWNGVQKYKILIPLNFSHTLFD